MAYLPSVVRARYRGGYRIHLTFSDRSAGTLDFRPWLKGPVFRPLKDRDEFRRFFVDGGTVTWPNGADIAPETLYAALPPRPTPSPRTRIPRPSQPARAR